MDRNRCENCGYYENAGGYSYCLRHSPILIVDPEKGAQTQWGRTAPKEWCSEFRDAKLHIRGDNCCRHCRNAFIRDNGQLTCCKNPPALQFNRANAIWHLSISADRWCGEFESKDVDHD